MNKKPISQLPDADTLTGNEYIPIVQNGVTKKTLAGNYIGEQGPAGISPIITAATPVVLNNGNISISYGAGLTEVNGSLVADLGSTDIKSFIEKNNLESIRSWNRELSSVRYSLESGALNQSTDVVVVGDSISEGWYGSQSNGTSWVQRFCSQISSLTNTGARTGSWVPAGTGASDSTWYTLPRFSPYPTTTVSVLVSQGTQYVSAVDDVEILGLKSNSTVKIGTETKTVVGVSSTVFTIDSPFSQDIPAGTPIYILGTEVSSRGFSLRSMNIPSGSKQSISFVGTSLSVFYRKANLYAAGGIRFSILDSSGNVQFIKNSFLASPVTSTSANSITLNDYATKLGLYPGVILKIGSEQMQVSSIPSSTSALVYVNRGVNGTTASTYSASTNVFCNYFQYLTFDNTGTYTSQVNGQEAYKVDLEMPDRNQYTLLVEHKIVSSAIVESPSGAFSASVLFDGIFIHDGTENQGVRVWNSSRYGSSFNSWANTEFDKVTTLSVSMDSLTQTVQLPSSASSLGIFPGDILSIYTDGSFFGYEHMQVISTNSNTCSVVRGYNGTTIGAHAANLPVQIAYTRYNANSLNDGWLSTIRQGLLSPSLYVIALGSNDQTSAITSDIIEQRMITIINMIRSAHKKAAIMDPSIVFMIPPLRTLTDVTEVQWDSCIARMYSVALYNNITIWDWAEYTGMVGVTSVNTLSGTIDSSTTTLPLSSTPSSSISVGSIVSMKSSPYGYLEKMFVKSIDGNNLTVQRGFAGSVAASHSQTYPNVYIGDSLFWTIDGIHPITEGQLSIGDFAANRALNSASQNPQVKKRLVQKTIGNTTLGSTSGIDYVYIITGAHTITLPTAISNACRYIVKNNHISNITIQSTGAQTIDGTTTISLAPGESVDLISDNSNWSII